VSSILAGQGFVAQPRVVADSVNNIAAIVAARRAAPLKPRGPVPDGIPAEVVAQIEAAEANLQGWCSREKALFLARTVLTERPAICVEIGVFGGRSVIPCAAALRHNGAGVIYGIETWSPDVATQNAINDEHDTWWATVDFPRIKRDFFRFLVTADLTRQVRVLEMPSAHAALMFDRIDMLHIDGCHSIVNAAEDVILYARKVRPGGIIIFDDIDWQSTAPARTILESFCDRVTVLTDPAVGHESCAVLRRR
jgi:predicted O-methyltransferase YrrM